jgi:putative hemolysin
VIDEYGSVQGMVSMDDILDALIGDVTEAGQQEYQIVQRDEHSWLADGAYAFFEFLHFFERPHQHHTGDHNTWPVFCCITCVIYLLQGKSEMVRIRI